MKKVFKAGIVLVLGIAMLISVATCAFPFQSPDEAVLQDISGTLNFTSISRQAFMGGSVLYNPDQPSSGQLAQGVHLAVRLGKVTREDKGDVPVFTDIEEEASYGYLTINSIDKDYVRFSYTRYSTAGALASTTAFTLYLNAELDLNGDGVNDITYANPARKRAGMEQAVYLTFLSSQEYLITSMFAVLPEQYSRGVYPSGLMGINPDGKFVVTKYEGSGKRAAIQGIVKGDYVLDAQVGAYQRFVSSQNYRSARSIDENDLEIIPSGISYYFSRDEFAGEYTAEDLFAALPDAIKERFEPAKTADEFILHLNQALEYTDLVPAVMATDSSVPQAEIDSLLSQAQALSETDLVKLNRLSLEKLYEENCPATNTTGADIIEVLPLVSVNIGDPDSAYSEENDRRARGVMKAESYSDYQSKKAAIDKKFAPYNKGQKAVFGLEKWKQNLKLPIKVESPEKVLGNSETKVNSMTVLSKTTASYPINLLDKIDLQMGVFGHFSITWGNISAGVIVGVYATGETGACLSASLLSSHSNTNKADDDDNVSSNSSTEIRKTVTPVSINLQLLSSPPIHIGVIYIKLTWNGYIDIPIEVYVSGDIVTTLYAGFTAFYAAGFEMEVNYGIKYKKVKILWATISIPTGFYLNWPDVKGKIIDDLAYYAGVIGDIRGGNIVQLRNAKIGFIAKPSISFGPSIMICDIVGGGVSVGPAFEVGFEVGTLPYNNSISQKDIYGDIICGLGLDVSFRYDVNLNIPLIMPNGIHGQQVLTRVGLERKAYRQFPK